MSHKSNQWGQALILILSAIFDRILFTASAVKWRKPHDQPRGQSLVEVAITLPVIILLFSGLIELGFILNYYLSLLDATREAARFYSNYDPFNPDLTDNLLFYQSTASMVYTELAPVNAQDTTRRIIMNPDTDDIIVSVFNIQDTGAVNPANVCNSAAPGPEKTITRHPGAGDYRFYENLTSGISTQDICGHITSGSEPTAILLVEVYYAYKPLLAITAPILNITAVRGPLMLHAYSMMPMPPVSLSSRAPMEFAFSFPSDEK